jgi:hypothetical protein
MQGKIKCLLKALPIVLVIGCTTPSNTGQTLPSTSGDAVKRFPIKDAHMEVFRDSVRPIHGELKAKYHLARHFQRIFKHRIAVEALKEVILMDPTYADAHNAIGFSYDCIGDYQMARHHYRTAIVINPEMDHAYNNLGYSYILDGNYPLAIETLKQAIVLNDANEKYHKNLGLAYYNNGDLAMAAFEFSKIKGSDNIEQIMTWLGMISDVGLNDEVDKTKPIQSAAVQLRENEKLHNPPDSKISTDPAVIEDKGNLDISPEVKTINVLLEPIFTQNDTSGKLVTEDIPSGKTRSASATIEIANGNGIRNMARSVGRYLKNEGVQVSRLTNAGHFGHANTIIYYDEAFYKEASRIKDLLHGLSGQGRLAAANLDREPIRVLIGRDLVPFKHQYMPTVHVNVSNGNGINGMAGRLGKYLAREGFRIGSLTNADHFGYKKTVIFHGKGNANQAKLVAQALPGESQSQMVELNNSTDLVQVRLGADVKY